MPRRNSNAAKARHENGVDSIRKNLKLPPQPSIFELMPTYSVTEFTSSNGFLSQSEIEKNSFTRTIIGFSDTAIEKMQEYGFMADKESELSVRFYGKTTSPKRHLKFWDPRLIPGQENTSILTGKLAKDATAEIGVNNPNIIQVDPPVPLRLNNALSNLRVELGETPEGFDPLYLKRLLGDCALRISAVVEINGTRLNPEDNMDTINSLWR